MLKHDFGLILFILIVVSLSKTSAAVKSINSCTGFYQNKISSHGINRIKKMSLRFNYNGSELENGDHSKIPTGFSISTENTPLNVDKVFGVNVATLYSVVNRLKILASESQFSLDTMPVTLVEFKAEQKFHLLDVGELNLLNDRVGLFQRAMSLLKNNEKNVYDEGQEFHGFAGIVDVEYRDKRLEIEEFVSKIKAMVLQKIFDIYKERKHKEDEEIDRMGLVSKFVSSHSRIFSVFQESSSWEYLHSDIVKERLQATISYHPFVGRVFSFDRSEKSKTVDSWVNYPMFLNLDSLEMSATVYGLVVKKAGAANIAELARAVKFKNSASDVSDGLFSLVLLKSLEQAEKDKVEYLVIKADALNAKIFKKLYFFKELLTFKKNKQDFQVLGMAVSKDYESPFQYLKRKLEGQVNSLRQTDMGFKDI